MSTRSRSRRTVAVLVGAGAVIAASSLPVLASPQAALTASHPGQLRAAPGQLVPGTTAPRAVSLPRSVHARNVGESLSQTFTNPDSNPDQYGQTLAGDGTTLAVGAYAYGDYRGQVLTYTNTADTYGAPQTISDPNSTPGSDNFGFGIAISGTTMAISAPYEANTSGTVGDVYLYTYSHGAWALWSTIRNTSNSPDGFGDSIALDGSYLYIGDPYANSFVGQVQIESLNGPSDYQTMTPPLSNSGTALFGSALAVNDGALVVGAPGAQSSAGMADIYTQAGGQFALAGTVTDPGVTAGDNFGSSLAINSRYIFVSATAGDGVVYSYGNDGAYHLTDTITDPNGDQGSGDVFGSSLSTSTGFLVVGAPGAQAGAGSVFAFADTGGYSQQFVLADPANTANDYFGQSVLVAGDQIFAGAPGTTSSQGVAYSFGIAPTISLYCDVPSTDTTYLDRVSATLTPPLDGTVSFVDVNRANHVLVANVPVSRGAAYSGLIFPYTGTIGLQAQFTPTAGGATTDSATVPITVQDNGGAFSPMSPVRILDTRNGTGVTGGHPTTIAAGGSLTVQVAGHNNVPSTGVGSALLNMTVVASSTAAGSITVSPAGGQASTVPANTFGHGQVVAAAVLARLGTTGAITVHNTSTGPISLIADIEGVVYAGTASAAYFTPATTSATVLDTRHGIGAPAHALAAGASVTFTAASAAGGVSATSEAVALALQVISPTVTGTLTVVGSGYAAPGILSQSFPATTGSSNLQIVSLDPGHSGDVTIKNNSAGPINLVATTVGSWSSGNGGFGSLVPQAGPQILIPYGGGSPTTPVASHDDGFTSVGQFIGSLGTLEVTNVTSPGFVTLFPGEDNYVPWSSAINFTRGSTVVNTYAIEGAGYEASLAWNSSSASINMGLVSNALISEGH
jgi:FG-GAP repeat